MLQVIVSANTSKMRELIALGIPEGMAVISIRNHGDGLPVEKPRERCLLLSFDDRAEVLPNSMTTGQAAAVRDFVLLHRENISTLIVQCSAGESRSPAVAAAILRACGMSDMPIWKNPHYRPNALCYRLVLEAFHVRPVFLKYRCRINRRAFRRAGRGR